MRKILICCLVALFLPFLMTTNTKAEELDNQEIEILDFSETAKDGIEGTDPVVRSLPPFPTDLTNDQQLFQPFLARLLSWSFDSNGNTTYGSGNKNVLVYVTNILVLLVPFAVGIVFFWWGLRKTVSAIMSAFKKGKLRI